MAIFIPKKKEFWNRKPSSDVEIDYNNSLSDGLRAAFIFNTEIPYDIVNNISGSNINNSIYTPEEGWTFDTATQNYLQFPDRDVYSFLNNAKLSIFSKISQVQGAALGIIAKFSDEVNFDGEYVLRKSADDTVLFQLLDSGTSDRCMVTTTNTFPVDCTTITATYDGSLSDSGLNIYFADALQPVIPKSQDAAYSGMSNRGSPLHLGSSLINSIYNIYSTGTISIATMYERDLSSSEIGDLDFAPYQILKPRKTYFVLGATPNPPFQPSWAYKTNTLIGGL